jgi:hypothetical protein
VLQENDHATAAALMLGSHLSQAIHIPCRITALEHAKNDRVQEECKKYLLAELGQKTAESEEV